MTKVLTLSDFLLARIAEDKATAQGALDDDGERWAVGGLRYDPSFDAVVMLDRSEVQVAKVDKTNAHHIARHDPARVLAECEAKRRVVEMHEDWPVSPGAKQLTCAEDGSTTWPCPTLRLLAVPYDSHPDYDESWRP